MTNKELQSYLKQFPEDMEVKIMPDHEKTDVILPFELDNILHTSETAYVDTEAPESEWDVEDGKVELGDGMQYLLINPIII